MSDKFETNTPAEVRSVDEAVALVINSIMKNGQYVSDGISNRGNFIEIRNAQFILNQPRKRITINPKRPLELITAIARFVWMISGSDRLSEIAFYQEQVRSFTDNGLSIPGSNYGNRMFQPQAGVDQIDAVIQVLKENPASRRACVSIWQPNDVTRIKSRDLPCAFGLGFQLRDNKLFTILIMRSNNACTLLHVNLFEFTLLGEIVAAELGIEYGGHVHDVFSMHIFAKDRKLTEEILNSFKEIENDDTYIMPPMPNTPSPLEQAKTLARLEADLRNKNVFKDISNLEKHLADAKNLLHPYWLEFYKILVIGVLVNVGKSEKAMDLAISLPPYFKGIIISRLKDIQEKAKAKITTIDMYVKKPTRFDKLKEIFALSQEEKKVVENDVKSHCEDWNKSKRKKLTQKDIQRVLEIIIIQKASVAARSRRYSLHQSPNDYLKISQAEAFDIIKKILYDNKNNSKLI